MKELKLIVTEALCNDCDNEGWPGPVAQRLGITAGVETERLARIACESQLFYEKTDDEQVVNADIIRRGSAWLRPLMGKTVSFEFELG